MSAAKAKAKPTGKHSPVPVPVDAVFISSRQLLARYGGRSQMWLYRKLQAEPEFPKPTYFGRLQFYRLDELERYEKQAVTRGAKG
jgi:hypothetical protein